MIVDGQGKLKAKRINQRVYHELCANLIIRHGLPFNFVEYEVVRSWITYMNPNAILLSRNMMKSDTLRIFMKEKPC